MAKKFRKLRHSMSYYLFVVLLGLMRILPLWLGHVVFGAIGVLVYTVGGKDVERLRENIITRFPHKSEKEVHTFCRAVYRNQGIFFFDGIRLPWYSLKKFFTKVHIHNKEGLVEALKSQKGVISLSGHVSAFELQTQVVALSNLPVFSVGAPLFDKRIDTLFTKLRTRNGVEYILRDGAARKIMRKLKENKVFGVLIDQDTTDDGVFAPFLGELAFTPVSMLRVALKYEIPLFYSLMHRDKKGVYHLNNVGPIDLIRCDDPQEELVRNIEEFNRVYSEHILKYPEQWVWMHRRWKRKREEYPAIPATTDYPRKESL